MVNNMTKRRITKASKRRLTFFGTISVIAIIYFVFSLFLNIYSIYSLTIEKNNLEKKYINLQEKAEELKIDIEKFNDEKYLADYARENYLYTKDGEYVIKLDDLNETKDNIEKLDFDIKNNYIVLVLSVLMFLIFIYIMLKGKKRKSK